MAAGSTSSSGSGYISSKPWFMTFIPENGVLIWRNQCRLKVAGKESAGRVIDVSVEDEVGRLIMVSLVELAD